MNAIFGFKRFLSVKEENKNHEFKSLVKESGSKLKLLVTLQTRCAKFYPLKPTLTHKTRGLTTSGAVSYNHPTLIRVSMPVAIFLVSFTILLDL